MQCWVAHLEMRHVVMLVAQVMRKVAELAGMINADAVVAIDDVKLPPADVCSILVVGDESTEGSSGPAIAHVLVTATKCSVRRCPSGCMCNSMRQNGKCKSMQQKEGQHVKTHMA